MTKKRSTNKKVAPRKARSNPFTIPAKLLVPVAQFLKASLKKLERTKRNMTKEDPFADSSRLNDNASPDTDAAEQFGHARTTAIKEQVDKKMIQTKKALARLRIGKYGICEVCGNMIDTDRLMIYPETTLCTKHASKTK